MFYGLAKSYRNGHSLKKQMKLRKAISFSTYELSMANNVNALRNSSMLF